MERTEIQPLASLLDMLIIQRLTDSFYEATGAPLGVIDALDNSILVASGWMDICVKFHRAHPISCQRCWDSDNYIKSHLVDGEWYGYRCQNGLWDIGMPIIVAGQHLATLFLGQFFYEGEGGTAQHEFFVQQGRELGYDLDSYLAAVDRVLVLSHAKADMILVYYKALTRFIIDLADRSLEKMQAEQAVQESEKKYRNVFEHSIEGIYQVSPEGRVLIANPSMARILGYASPAELIANLTNVRQQLYVRPEECDAFLDLLLKQTSVERQEFEFYRKDHQRIWVSVNARLVRNEAGEPICIEGFMTDITANKHAEADRERLIAELEAKNTELERFTYTVAHDLKSPLVTIRAFLGYVRQAALDGNTEQTQADIARIANAADQMQQLLNDLLELSRVGRVVGVSQPIALGELAQEAIDLVTGHLATQPVHIQVAANLPVVWGDRGRLREVFENLLENAIKYLGNQPNPQIEIGVRGNDPEQILYVRDNGIGIEPRYHQKIFGLFDKLDPKSKGMGLGLAIVKRIVELHGGRIWVESEGIGRGSTFCFTLAAGPDHDKPMVQD